VNAITDINKALEAASIKTALLRNESGAVKYLAFCEIVASVVRMRQLQPSQIRLVLQQLLPGVSCIADATDNVLKFPTIILLDENPYASIMAKIATRSCTLCRA
jgi:hypothetical protein